MVQVGGGNSSSSRDADRNGLSSPRSQNTFSMAQHDAIESAAMAVCQDLFDDAILDVAFEVHRSVKKGLLFLETGSPTDEKKFLQVNAEGLDVFGQAPAKKQQDCVCPNCQRSLAASRFAPHLEKCMGMGRNSSRIANRRIQSSSRESSNSHASHGSDDDDDDEDWIANRKKIKRDKNSPRRTKSHKHLHVIQGNLATLGNSQPADSTTNNIISHRISLLQRDDIQEDKDHHCEEGVLVAPWEHDLSNTTSPADSTSTNNSSSTASSSSSSSNQKKSGKSKRKNARTSSRTSNGHGSHTD